VVDQFYPVSWPRADQEGAYWEAESAGIQEKQFFDCISFSRKNAHPLGGYWVVAPKLVYGLQLECVGGVSDKDLDDI
jgi:hypothetical protein